MSHPAQVLDDACPAIIPGAVACVVSQGKTVFHHAAGWRSLAPQKEANAVDTVYDLASLTKPMAVGSILLCGLADGHLSLDEPVYGETSVRHLAGHTSGLPAWRDFGLLGIGSRAEMRAAISKIPLDAPVGERAIYSDLGYLLLGFWLEDRLGSPLDTLFYAIRDRVGLEHTCFCPQERTRIAPTEGVRGVVHDPNARLLGGVAGHAGLFGTAADVAEWGRHLLSASQSDTLPVKDLWSPPKPPPRQPSTWQLCFDSVTPGASSAGQHFGPQAVGHLGFTGTSVWIEPERDWVVVLLSNRVHPDGGNQQALKGLRPAFHDAVAEFLS